MAALKWRVMRLAAKLCLQNLMHLVSFSMFQELGKQLGLLFRRCFFRSLASSIPGAELPDDDLSFCDHPLVPCGREIDGVSVQVVRVGGVKELQVKHCGDGEEQKWGLDVW